MNTVHPASRTTAADVAGALCVRDHSGQLNVMPSVYSLAWPETNIRFMSVHWPPHLWRVTAPRSAFDEALTAWALDPLPEEGEKKLGLLDLVHYPIVDGIIDALGDTLPGIDSPLRPWRYPLHGSASGIGLLLTHLRVRHGTQRIVAFAGDYEGYAAQAASQGVAVRTVDADEAAELEGETVFLSNPSAVDGEPLDAAFVERLCERNRVVVDVAYHGMHGPSPTPIPQSAWAVLWSLSKPWGLFWRRVGLLVCSEEVPAAYGTRWFKDPERLLAAYEVVRAFPPHVMAERYRWAQHAALSALAAAGIATKASSTVLLGLVRRDEVAQSVWDEVTRCERRPGSSVARVCLTPLMEQALAVGTR